LLLLFLLSLNLAISACKNWAPIGASIRCQCWYHDCLKASLQGGRSGEEEGDATNCAIFILSFVSSDPSNILASRHYALELELT
jgi:hypothetical protein